MSSLSPSLLPENMYLFIAWIVFIPNELEDRGQVFSFLWTFIFNVFFGDDCWFLLDVSVSYGLLPFFSSLTNFLIQSLCIVVVGCRLLAYLVSCVLRIFHTDGRFSAEMCLLFGHNETQVCSPRAPEWVLFTVWSCSLAPEGPDTPSQHQKN